MPNYQDAKIYKITSPSTDKVYVGSTTLTLSLRFCGHKCDYVRWKSGFHNYISSYEIVKYDDCQIELIENFPCSGKKELSVRERYYIDNTENCTNKQLPTRSQKQWFKDNDEYLKQKSKIYREQNKEVLNEKKKLYYEMNKDEMNMKSKIRYEQNIEEIKQKRKIKHNCECGGVWSGFHKPRHIETKKHQDWLLSQTNQVQE